MCQHGFYGLPATTAAQYTFVVNKKALTYHLLSAVDEMTCAGKRESGHSFRYLVFDPAKMQFGFTRRQCFILLTVLSVGIVVALFPLFGAPHFRYTGSAPDHHVWNIGWPLVACIYDASHSPYFFVGPIAYLHAFVAAIGGTLLYATMIAWNNRIMLRDSFAMKSVPLDRYCPPYGPEVAANLDSFAAGLSGDYKLVLDLSQSRSRSLADYLLTLACKCQNVRNIQLGRVIFSELPKPWTLQYLECCAASIATGDDEWEYRRLLELADLIDREICDRFVKLGKQSSNPEIREVAEGFSGDGQTTA